MAGQTHRPRLSTDVRDRMGIYKSLSEVPDKYRLHHEAAAYDGRDVWAAFEADKTEDFDAKATRDRYEKAGRYLRSFMDGESRHHALADPEHIEAFLTALRDGEVGRHSHTRKLQTVYFEYYQPVEQFYTWLQWHADHPHVYHPVLMAAASGGYAREVWERKIAQNDKR